jgi:GH25 family lysozyme M1 (1,4-beta-N-acetylmuramidase)
MYQDQLTFSHKIRLWQYSDKGRVPGIEGNVDLNLYFPA